MDRRILIPLVAALMVAALAAVFFVRPGAGGAAGDLDLTAQPRLGAADAAVPIVVFEDFRCPHCATFSESVIPRLESELVRGGDAALYFVNFPILGPASVEAAEVAECAAAQSSEAFWSLEPILMRSQPSLDADGAALRIAREYAAVAGIDVPELENCLETGASAEAVAADAAAARALGIGGTPAVLVDGEPVPNPTFDAIVAAVREALADGE